MCEGLGSLTKPWQREDIFRCELLHTQSSYLSNVRHSEVHGTKLCAGRRQDNRAAERPGSGMRAGARFFADDEDEFGLEDLLQVRPSADIKA